jgi:hypothetical protein
MKLPQDDVERLLRRAGRLPPAGPTLAGGELPPAGTSTETAVCARAPWTALFALW